MGKEVKIVVAIALAIIIGLVAMGIHGYRTMLVPAGTARQFVCPPGYTAWDMSEMVWDEGNVPNREDHDFQEVVFLISNYNLPNGFVAGEVVSVPVIKERRDVE